MENPVQIAIFSKHLHWLDVQAMASKAACLGFSGIDLTVRDQGHVHPDRVASELPEAVKIIRDAGLEVPMITTGITDPADPVNRSIIETAGKLRIRVYRTGWFFYGRGKGVRESVADARRSLSGLANINRENGIASAYQNHAGHAVGASCWDLFEMIRDLDPRWSGVQFDIRHAVLEGPESWPYAFELLAPWINSMDMKDFRWESAAGKPQARDVPLGEGMVDFRSFLTMAVRLGIETDLSLHVEYPLGGAEHGSSRLHIPEKEFERKVAGDLSTLKGMLDRYGFQGGRRGSDRWNSEMSSS